MKNHLGRDAMAGASARVASVGCVVQASEKSDRVAVELKQPSVELVFSYLDFITEMRNAGEKIWDGTVPRVSEDPSLFVERLLRAEQSAEPGFVTESCYWAVMDGVVVGRISLRHHLTKDLEQFGGHIGYEVRPSVRKRGIAREMLRRLLEQPVAKRIGRVLLTCAPDNVGSNKTILANGGVLARTAFVEKWQRLTNYYWIDLR